MKNETGKAIAHIYQDIRNNNEQRVFQNIENIYMKHPRLKEIDQQILSENASLAIKTIYDGKLHTVSLLKEELIKKRNDYIAENSIDADFDKPIYMCKLCNDTGFLLTDKKKFCQCYQPKIIPLLLENSNFKNISKYSFNQFDISIFADIPDPKRYNSSNSPKNQIEGILNVSRQFIDEFDNVKARNLFFLGKPGTGKTFLSGCIANELLFKGKSVLYLSAPELFDLITEYRMLSNSYSPEPIRFEKATQLYKSILSCDLFILDDLGTETANANRQPELLNILNHRSDSNKKMLISTNMDTTTLSSLYDERVLSRIYGGFTVLRFFGEDLRHKKI